VPANCKVYHYKICAMAMRFFAHWRSQGARPPSRNWGHKKILGCAVELNTQNCAWFGSQISLITAMSFREAMPVPPEPPTRGSAPGPCWGTSVPQTPCAPTSKSWLRHCLCQIIWKLFYFRLHYFSVGLIT